MLTESQRERVTVVLVRARNPNNIGAVARAMHGFGFTDLRMVNDYTVALERARSAIDASAILASAREFATVEEAIADCTLVIGTTAVGERKQDHPLYILADGATLIRSAATASRGRVAILFGSEKTGLSNDALSHCHWLMTIPMHQTEGPAPRIDESGASRRGLSLRTDSRSSRTPAEQHAAGGERRGP